MLLFDSWKTTTERREHQYAARRRRCEPPTRPPRAGLPLDQPELHQRPRRMPLLAGNPRTPQVFFVNVT